MINEETIDSARNRISLLKFLPSYFIDDRVVFRMFTFYIVFDDDWVRVYKSKRGQSNPIELQSFDWLRLGSVIEHVRTHPKTFANRTESNLRKWKLQKLYTKFHLVSNKALLRLTNKLCLSLNISSTSIQGRWRKTAENVKNYHILEDMS